MKQVLFFVLLLSLGSCARNISSGSGNGGALSSYTEDLSAVRPVPEIELPATEEEGADLQESEPEEAAYLSEGLTNENERIDKAIGEIAAYNATQTDAPGFRIQVFSGNSRGEFESAKGYLLQHFPELEIYESYSQPTYRIKVGDFLRRMDAEQYYSSLRSRFSSSKIMMETVNLQNGLNIN